MLPGGGEQLRDAAAGQPGEGGLPAPPELHGAMAPLRVGGLSVGYEVTQ